MAVLLTNSIASSALEKTISLLNSGESAIDSIETGIRIVESDENAGWVAYGGYPNLQGKMELDAGIIDGKTLRAGAVGALQGFTHPISVAREVMNRLPHVILVGEGARKFAFDCGAEEGNNLSPNAQESWHEWIEINCSEEEKNNLRDANLIRLSILTANPKTAKGTTVFLAQDNNGNFSAGSSSSGWSFKYPGRLGDSPIIGSGIYADNRYGAAACTGMGELTLRSNTAHSVVLYMKMGMSIEDACQTALNDLNDIQVDFRGGVSIYSIDTKGNKYVLSVKAVNDGLPDCDEFYWYWDSSCRYVNKCYAVMSSWT